METQIVPVLPDDSAARKELPMATGLLDYFPAALAYVAMISKIGNDKHNPGEALHHARGKSMDHPDTILRHLTDRGTKDGQGIRHSGYLAWRALALLQEELEREEGAPLPRAARVAEPVTVVPAPDENPREGWVCPGCRTTAVYEGYTDGELRECLAGGKGPVCANLLCSVWMVRA